MLARHRGEGLHLFVEDRPYLGEDVLWRRHVQRIRLRARGRMQHEQQVDSLLPDSRLVPGELPEGTRRASDAYRRQTELLVAGEAGYRSRRDVPRLPQHVVRVGVRREIDEDVR